jgi:hypothetical protein
VTAGCRATRGQRRRRGLARRVAARERASSRARRYHATESLQHPGIAIAGSVSSSSRLGLGLASNRAPPFLAATRSGVESFDRSSGDGSHDSTGTEGEEDIGGGRAGGAAERGAAGNNHGPNP